MCVCVVKVGRWLGRACGISHAGQTGLRVEREGGREGERK